MPYSLSIEPYRTDRSDFRITVNREAARAIAECMTNEAAAARRDNGRPRRDDLDDLAFTISSALERWK